MALSKQPYKGARDFYPEEKRLQKYMFKVWRSVAESFGYEEYDAPILEPLEIYTAKTGEEIVNEQTYSFKDRGGRQVVIRPEMTPTVSRMVAGKRQELGYPLRWYSIPNLWRYERPQRGRLREHWQLNVDIFGVDNVIAEKELLHLIDRMFKAFGAKSNMYEIRLNNRELTDFMLKNEIGLSEKSAYKVGKLIDRFAKMTKTDFISAIDNVLTDEEKQSGSTEKLMSYLALSNINNLPKTVKKTEGFEQISDVLDSLKSSGIKNARFDPTLMRGFDYYTGLVFEVFDMDPENNRSMLGGGRYDGLVGLFGVQPVPTVGFGWGDVTLENFLSNHRLFKDVGTETDIYIVRIGELDVQSIADELRDQGLNITVDLSGKKIGDQIKTALKKQIQNVLIVGEDELKTGKYQLKDLNSGKSKELTLTQIAKALKK